MTLADLRQKLNGNNFLSLSKEDRSKFKQLLRSTERGFNADQRSWLDNIYLVASQEIVDTMNQAMEGTRFRVTPRTTLDGRVVINAYITTNCLDPDETYYPIREILATLPFTRILPTEFPDDNTIAIG